MIGFLLSTILKSQNKYPFQILILNENKKPLSGVKIKINDYSKTSDLEGKILFQLDEGRYVAKIQSQGYEEKEIGFLLDKSLKIITQLQKENILEEVVITAKENKEYPVPQSSTTIKQI